MELIPLGLPLGYRVLLPTRCPPVEELDGFAASPRRPLSCERRYSGDMCPAPCPTARLSVVSRDLDICPVQQDVVVGGGSARRGFQSYL